MNDGQVDGGSARHALLDPGGYGGAVRFEAGDGAPGPACGSQGGCNGRIVGQRIGGIEPTLCGGSLAPLTGLVPAHDLSRSNVPIRVALAHAQQGLGCRSLYIQRRQGQQPNLHYTGLAFGPPP